jgi:hypothetical protein
MQFDKSVDHKCSGAFAVVFQRGLRGNVFKLFRSDRSNPGMMSDHKRRRIFQSEVDAYRIAEADSVLSAMIPHFYGPRIIERVIDSLSGADLSDLFLLDCCYEMEDVGYCKKANDEREVELRARLDRQQALFEKRGIKYMIDCSFAIMDDDRIVFVDFGTQDIHGDASQ